MTAKPAAGNARDAWAARAAPRPTRSRRKKILVAGVLAAIGAAVLLIGWWMYPQRAEVSAPAVGEVDITPDSNFVQAHTEEIDYTVTQARPDLTRLTIQVGLDEDNNPKEIRPAGMTTNPIPPRQSEGLILTVVSGDTIMRCSPSCAPVGDQALIYPIFFNRTTGTATASIDLKARSYGVAANGATAVVTFPAVGFYGTQPTQMIVRYPVPSASSYDWSSYPASSLTTFDATWVTTVAAGTAGAGGLTNGHVATGVNHAAQTHDSNLTLIAGVLFGIGGAALVTATQEALHAND